MRDVNRSRVVMAGCVLLIVAGGVLAQDWPQWRGPGRDGKVSGFTAPQKWPQELAQKWKITVGTGCATPALVGDRLYVFARQGDDEVTLCLNAGTGKEIWRNQYAAQAVTGAASRHPGPRSSPAVADGKVVTLGVGAGSSPVWTPARASSCGARTRSPRSYPGSSRPAHPSSSMEWPSRSSGAKTTGRSSRTTWLAAMRSGAGPAKGRRMPHPPC